MNNCGLNGHEQNGGDRCEREQRARGLFLSGYNCAQSLAGAFADELGLDFETAVRLASTFGGGIGRLREACGAVTGMTMVLGMKYGYSVPGDDVIKMQTYAMVQELAEKFRAENGSLICRELLGLPEGAGNDPKPEVRTASYYAKRPCENFIGSAARILSEYIERRSAGEGDR